MNRVSNESRNNGGFEVEIWSFFLVKSNGSEKTMAEKEAMVEDLDNRRLI